MGEDNNMYYLKFPIFTVCENYYLNKDLYWKKTMNTCYEELQSEKSFLSSMKSCLKNISDESFREFLKNLTLKHTDIIQNVRFFYDANLNYKSLQTNWTNVFHEVHGLCFSLDLSKTSLPDMAAKVKLSLLILD